MTAQENVNAVEVKLILPETRLSGPITYTSMFLIPAYNIYLDDYLTGLLVNSYIDDAKVKHLFRQPMFMLLKIKDIDRMFYQIDRYLRENKNFVYTYIVGKTHDGEHLYMYVFECPEEFSADYDKILDSKYSHTSDAFKSLFHKELIFDGKKVENPTYGILHKTKTMKRNMESKLSVVYGREINSPVILDPGQEYFGRMDKALEIFRFT